MAAQKKPSAARPKRRPSKRLSSKTPPRPRKPPARPRAPAVPEPVKRSRGLTTTPDERAAAARIERALHAAGLTLARVIPVAKNRAGAMLRIERIPLAEIDKLRVALGHLRKP